MPIPITQAQFNSSRKLRFKAYETDLAEQRGVAASYGAAIVLLVLAVSPPLLLTLGPAALAFPALVAAILFIASPATVPPLLLGACVFQNLAIAIWVSPTATVAEINAARALSFVVTLACFCTAVFCAMAWRWRFSLSEARLIRWCALCLAVVALFTAVGAAIAGPAGALTYARNMGLAPISLIIGLAVGRQQKSAGMGWFTVAFTMLLALGYSELVFREAFYTLVGMDEFLLRVTERAADIQYRYFLGFSQWLKAQETVLFNDPNLALSGLRTVRLQGPTAHPISFGYALVITSLPLMARAPLLAALLQLPIQYGINSKGAFLLLLLCLAVRLAASVLLRTPRWTRASAIIGVWALVAASGVVLGLQHGDFHVLGFLGGFKALIANPLGHGIGTAGNLTEAGINGQIDWGTLQRAGAADRGIESAIGVLVDQLGVFALAYLSLCVAVLRRLMARNDVMSLIVFSAVVGLLANGVLQEEALFSPSSAGLLFFLVGMIIAVRQKPGFVGAAPAFTYDAGSRPVGASKPA
ncbi:hypothetical protein ABEG18_06555 [Alsobacter sp. KACC 23698]|uniref:O-antigen ligase family protein n=1 Tax=Alsobacter sp. KACC 23698 TaxID=3149229 RepID=A0AAU7JJ57_9HYPH